MPYKPKLQSQVTDSGHDLQAELIMVGAKLAGCYVAGLAYADNLT